MALQWQHHHGNYINSLRCSATATMGKPEWEILNLDWLGGQYQGQQGWWQMMLLRCSWVYHNSQILQNTTVAAQSLYMYGYGGGRMCADALAGGKYHGEGRQEVPYMSTWILSDKAVQSLLLFKTQTSHLHMEPNNTAQILWTRCHHPTLPTAAAVMLPTG